MDITSLCVLVVLTVWTVSTVLFVTLYLSES
jgi:hypothetical protein